jgi:hypothetical protein
MQIVKISRRQTGSAIKDMESFNMYVNHLEHMVIKMPISIRLTKEQVELMVN